MTTGKERLRRWRERNRAEGKQSFTVMLSQETKNVLREEKKVSGRSYSAIIEQALLNFRKTIAPVVGDHAPKKNKILIDEDGVLRGEVEWEEGYRGQSIIEETSQLGTGFIPRLLRRSNNKIYKLRKW